VETIEENDVVVSFGVPRGEKLVTRHLKESDPFACKSLGIELKRRIHGIFGRQLDIEERTSAIDTDL
jgi:hypothetical protein